MFRSCDIFEQMRVSTHTHLQSCAHPDEFHVWHYRITAFGCSPSFLVILRHLLRGHIRMWASSGTLSACQCSSTIDAENRESVLGVESCQEVASCLTSLQCAYGVLCSVRVRSRSVSIHSCRKMFYLITRQRSLCTARKAVEVIFS